MLELTLEKIYGAATPGRKPAIGLSVYDKLGRNDTIFVSPKPLLTKPKPI